MSPKERIETAINAQTPISFAIFLALATAIGGAVLGKFKADAAYELAEKHTTQITILEETAKYDREQRSRVDRALERIETAMRRMDEHIARDERGWKKAGVDPDESPR